MGKLVEETLKVMETIQHKTLDEERALYASRNIRVEDCRFDGPADGESALKESRDVEVNRCFFNLRYPFFGMMII